MACGRRFQLLERETIRYYYYSTVLTGGGGSQLLREHSHVVRLAIRLDSACETACVGVGVGGAGQGGRKTHLNRSAATHPRATAEHSRFSR